MSHSKFLLTTLSFLVASSIGNFSSAAQPPGLIAHWNFNDCTATDVSGNNNNGIIHGTPQCVDSVIGKGLLFNGTSDYIEIPNSPSLNLTSITLVAWINPTRLFNGDQIIINKENQYEISLAGQNLPEGQFVEQGGISKGNIMFAFDDNTASWKWYSGNTKPPINQFTLISTSLDINNNYKIYSNIKLTRSGIYPVKPAQNTRCLRIGARNCPNVPASYFAGIIDEVQVYNRALSQAEIQGIYYTAYPPGVNGTAPWATPRTITCNNLSNGTSVTISLVKSSNWDCETSGLSINHGDTVSVTIQGKKY